MRKSSFLFGVFIWISFIVLVGAVTWVGSDVNYYVNEDTTYYHNLSQNITGFGPGITFAIDSEQAINWTNYQGNSSEVSAADVSGWIWINVNELIINATIDSETGFFVIPIQANNDSGDDTSTDFEFQVNATNDLPIFTLDFNYSFPVLSEGITTENITLVGSDEEEHYPLNYNISFDDCEFAAWSTRSSPNCNLSYNMTRTSNTTSVLELYNMTNNDIGTYNITICSTDNLNGTSLPAYYGSDYLSNKTYCQQSEINLLSTLSINISDCDGTNWTEGDTLNCVINITTIGEDNTVLINSDADFYNDAGAPRDSNWFFSTVYENASNNIISLNISIPLGKEEVGNWSIDFSADDGSLVEIPRPVVETISIFVDFIESGINLQPIGDLTGANALYSNRTIQITAVDDDLLIWDDSVKKENLTFFSNVSWVDFTYSNLGDSVNNFRVADLKIDQPVALGLVGEGNFSIRVTVEDEGGTNTDFEDFMVEIINDTAPEWDGSLSNPVYLLLTEDSLFTYDLQNNITDVDGDTVTFYYLDSGVEFCGLNSTNFQMNGLINFTPTDCDVGYHDITIIATDNKLNSSHSFNFTVVNINDQPVIAVVPSDVVTGESDLTQIDMQVDDFDFLIPVPQRAISYSENLTIILTIENLTPVVTPVSFEFISLGFSSETELFRALFTPDEENVGNYNITINASDSLGLYDVASFILNITQVNDPPVLNNIPDQEVSSYDLFYYDVNATDEEDSPTLPESGLLNYSLQNLTVSGDFLTINLTTGIMNHSMNESFVGEYQYNLTVTDSDGGADFQVFSLTVYGAPNITWPIQNYVFNWTENLEDTLEFQVDHLINDTNLTYEFYMDDIVYTRTVDVNGTNLTYVYTNLSDGLIHTVSHDWVVESNFTWNFTPSYSDETYGMFKNFTLVVYNPNFPELNDSMNWKANVTHMNQNITFNGVISDKGPTTATFIIIIDLKDYFNDSDYSDDYWNQNVSFDIVTAANSTNNIETASSIDSNWILSLTSPVAAIETISILAIEYGIGSNVSIGNATSNEFTVEFIVPEEIPTPTKKSATIVKLQHFSLKIVAPRDIIFADERFIEVPFSIVNTGTMDLVGIDLSSHVLFNNEYSEDVRIELEDTFIEKLSIGESKDYTLKVYADTTKSGKYKATIFGNVTSPKFSDWGDFFIELHRTNESEAEQILIFTEQLITDNPECLELTEVLNRAKDAFGTGDSLTAISLANEVTEACEEAILKNDQVKYKVEGFIERNFYYILFLTLIVFVVGFIFYIWKRVRFNKYEEDYTMRGENGDERQQ